MKEDLNPNTLSEAKKFLENYRSTFGAYSDQGSNFKSQVFGEVAKLLGLRKTWTTLLHPQSNGMVERFNKTKNQFLSKVVHIDQQNWDKLLPLFLLAYWSSIHNSTYQGNTCVNRIWNRALIAVQFRVWYSPQLPRKVKQFT